MDKLRALETFTQVVDAGGFSAAARLMDLSVASVSAQVDALEKSLKTRLLSRSTRKIALTEEGAAYYDHAMEILDRMREAEAMLSSQKTSPKGLLRVAMPQLLAFRLVFPEMPRFLVSYPDMRVEFTLSAQAPSFSAQNLDMAFQITAEFEQGLVFRPLGLIPMVTVAAPAYLARHGRPSTPEELVRDHQIIGVRAAPGVPTSVLRFERDRKMLSFEHKARVIADSGEAQRLLGLAEIGVFQGARYAVEDLIRSGQLEPILDDWAWSGPPLGIVHPRNRFLQPRVGVFVDFMRELLAGKISPYRVDWVAPAP